MVRIPASSMRPFKGQAVWAVPLPIHPLVPEYVPASDSDIRLITDRSDPSEGGGNSRPMTRNFRPFLCLFGTHQSANRPSTSLPNKDLMDQRFGAPIFVVISLVLALHNHRDMLTRLKRRVSMSPLLLMLLLSLVPFPVLAIALLANRLMRAANKAMS